MGKITAKPGAPVRVMRLHSRLGINDARCTQQGKLLADQISLERSGDDDFREDPNIPEEFYSWASKQRVKSFHKLMNEKGVFTAQEVARKTNLMHTLNVMAAVLGGFSNRNEKATELLDDYAFSFTQRDEIVRISGDPVASVMPPARIFGCVTAAGCR